MSSAAALSSAQCKEALLSRVILEFQLEILKTFMEFACSSDANNQPWVYEFSKNIVYIFNSCNLKNKLSPPGGCLFFFQNAIVNNK